MQPSSGQKNNWEEAVSSGDSSELEIVSGLVDRDWREVNLSSTTSSTHLDSFGIGVSLLPLANLLGLIVLPGPIPYAFHVVIQSSPYSTFDTALTPSNLTLAENLGFSISHNVTWRPDTPPDDLIASTIWAEFSMSLPSLRWILIWALIVAAFLSHAPFPAWGSEKSSRLTVTPWTWAAFDAPIIVAPLRYHPALPCL